MNLTFAQALVSLAVIVPIVGVIIVAGVALYLIHHD